MKSIIQEQAKQAVADSRNVAQAVRRAASNKELKSAARRVERILLKHGASPNVFFTASGVTIYCYPKVDSFAVNPELLAQLEAVSEALGGAEWKSHDYPSIDQREFKIAQQYGAHRISVEVNATLIEGSEKCRRVVKSVKLTENVEYAFEC